MAQQMTPAASTWKVTSQVEQAQGSPQGIVRGVLITFTTGLGNTGTVFVSNDRYNATNAYAAIMERATMLDSVSQLTN
jgi:hypothetical protein